MSNCIPKMKFDDGVIQPKGYTVMILVKCVVIGMMMGGLIMAAIMAAIK